MIGYEFYRLVVTKLAVHNTASGPGSSKAFVNIITCNLIVRLRYQFDWVFIRGTKEANLFISDFGLSLHRETLYKDSEDILRITLKRKRLLHVSFTR